MSPIYWTFVVFALMWIAMIAGYVGVVRLLNEHQRAIERGEKTWDLGL